MASKMKKKGLKSYWVRMQCNWTPAKWQCFPLKMFPKCQVPWRRPIDASVTLFCFQRNGWFLDHSLWEGFISVLSLLLRDAHSRELRARVTVSNSQGFNLNCVCHPLAVRHWVTELSSVCIYRTVYSLVSGVCIYGVTRGRGRLLHYWIAA